MEYHLKIYLLGLLLLLYVRQTQSIRKSVCVCVLVQTVDVLSLDYKQKKSERENTEKKNPLSSHSPCSFITIISCLADVDMKLIV